MNLLGQCRDRPLAVTISLIPAGPEFAAHPRVTARTARAVRLETASVP